MYAACCLTWNCGEARQGIWYKGWFRRSGNLSIIAAASWKKTTLSSLMKLRNAKEVNLGTSFWAKLLWTCNLIRSCASKKTPPKGDSFNISVGTWSTVRGLQYRPFPWTNPAAFLIGCRGSFAEYDVSVAFKFQLPNWRIYSALTSSASSFLVPNPRPRCFSFWCGSPRPINTCRMDLLYVSFFSGKWVWFGCVP